MSALRESEDGVNEPSSYAKALYEDRVAAQAEDQRAGAILSNLMMKLPDNTTVRLTLSSVEVQRLKDDVVGVILERDALRAVAEAARKHLAITWDGVHPASGDLERALAEWGGVAL